MAYCYLVGREEKDSIFECPSLHTYVLIALDCVPKKQGGEHYPKLLGRFFISYRALGIWSPELPVLTHLRHHLQTERSILMMPAPISWWSSCRPQIAIIENKHHRADRRKDNLSSECQTREATYQRVQGSFVIGR